MVIRFVFSKDVFALSVLNWREQDWKTDQRGGHSRRPGGRGLGWEVNSGGKLRESYSGSWRFWRQTRSCLKVGPKGL